MIYLCKHCNSLINQRKSTKGVTCPCCGKVLGKQAETSHKKLKSMAWRAFSDYIRLRDAILTTGTDDECICYTCKKRYPLIAIQAGHLIDGRQNVDLLDEELVKGQCRQCNVLKHGMQGVFLLNILKEKAETSRYENVSLSEIDKMLDRFQNKRQTVLNEEDLFEIYKKYTRKIKELRAQFEKERSRVKGKFNEENANYQAGRRTEGAVRTVR